MLFPKNDIDKKQTLGQSMSNLFIKIASYNPPIPYFHSCLFSKNNFKFLLDHIACIPFLLSVFISILLFSTIPDFFIERSLQNIDKNPLLIIYICNLISSYLFILALTLICFYILLFGPIGLVIWHLARISVFLLLFWWFVFWGGGLLFYLL